jgi:hypothetical protein
MKNYLLTFGIFALCCSATPGFAGSVDSVCDAVAGNLVQNCGFESGNFSSWTVLNNDGNTDVEMDSFALGLNSGDFYAALGDASSAPTTIEQTFADGVGSSLTFSFYVATDGTGGGLVADFDGTTLLSLSNTSANGYTEYSFSATGTGSDTISFIEEGPIGSYIGLDDVIVVDPPAVPEPSSVAFLVVGLGAIVLAHRRFTKKTA